MYAINPELNDSQGLVMEKTLQGYRRPHFLETKFCDEKDDFSNYFYSGDNRLMNREISTQSAISKLDNVVSSPSGLEESVSSRQLVIVLVYFIMFTIAAVGNVSIFVVLLRSRRRKSRVTLMMTHLAFADLIVTFIMMPLEMTWRLTVQWLAGNLACKVFLVLRAFGLYLSSNILVCISLDRYFAVLHPLRVTAARRRSKVMLCCAWLAALITSLPQSVVFHVASPEYRPDFQQCVSFGTFQERSHEVAYNLFCVAAVYIVPLLAITVAYTRIFCEIARNSKEHKDGLNELSKGTSSTEVGARLRLRRSDARRLERARSRTLCMTLVIVSTFAACWTPYSFITLWYMFDEESALQIDKRIQDSLFMMAVSNTCVNPVVYGTYALNLRSQIVDGLRYLFCAKRCQDSRHGKQGLTGSPVKTRPIRRSLLFKVNKLRASQSFNSTPIPKVNQSDNLLDPEPSSSYCNSCIQSEPPLPQRREEDFNHQLDRSSTRSWNTSTYWSKLRVDESCYKNNIGEGLNNKVNGTYGLIEYSGD